ncbi:MAG TPA: hypothetical protein PKV69_03465, partial [Candidatus Hydrogenedentes bacterium]|nr:hypothetical protein [Candidatus Hydrogenedentota bacterium]
MAGRIWAVVPYVLCVVVGGSFVVGWHYLQGAHMGREEARFREYSDLLVQETSTRIRETAYLAKGFAGLMMGLEAATDEQLWRTYYEFRGVRENFPWIAAISFSPHIAPYEVDAFVAAIQAGGRTDYR